MDENRYEDGMALSNRCELGNIRDYGDFPCTMLEMMAALALRCEESIMFAPGTDNGAGELFWKMIDSLGLSEMKNGCFDREKADCIIFRLLEHKYESNGKGGLFQIDDEFLKHVNKDMRKMEIWDQMGLYIIFEKENKK